MTYIKRLQTHPEKDWEMTSQILGETIDPPPPLPVPSSPPKAKPAKKPVKPVARDWIQTQELLDGKQTKYRVDDISLAKHFAAKKKDNEDSIPNISKGNTK